MTLYLISEYQRRHEAGDVRVTIETTWIEIEFTAARWKKKKVDALNTEIKLLLFQWMYYRSTHPGYISYKCLINSWYMWILVLSPDIRSWNLESVFYKLINVFFYILSFMPFAEKLFFTQNPIKHVWFFLWFKLSRHFQLSLLSCSHATLYLWNMHLL